MALNGLKRSFKGPQRSTATRIALNKRLAIIGCDFQDTLVKSKIIIYDISFLVKICEIPVGQPS